MFCSKCGNVVKEEMCYCSKCGNLIEKQDALIKIHKKNRNKNSKIIIGVVFAFLIIGVILLFAIKHKNNALNIESVEEILSSSTNVSMYIGGEDVLFSINEITNVSIKKEDEDNVYHVVCNADISCNSMKAQVKYNVVVKKVEKSWVIENSYIEDVYEIEPLVGAKEPWDLVESTVQELYPGIRWGYQYDAAFKNDLNYDFSIQYDLENRNTNLEGKQDQFIFNYSFDTYTAHVTGKVEFNYEFSEEGIWVLIETNSMEESIEWDLVGVWSFDIYTNYIDVSIYDMDFASHIAKVKRKGSSFYGSGSAETLEIGFEEEENCLYFDTFTIPRRQYSSDAIDITLTAKLDDLYYKCPSMFNGAEAVEVGIGGKSEEIVVEDLKPQQATKTALPAEAVEKETFSLNEIWNTSKEAIADGTYEKHKVGVGYYAYYSGTALKAINISMGMISEYETTILLENEEVIFANYESAKENNYLYFKNGQLFRWIQIEKIYGEEQESIYHDNEFDNDVFAYWEQQVVEDYNYVIKKEE